MINHFFHSELDSYYNQEKKFLLPFIPDGPNVVMDLGCASGKLGRILLEQKKAIELIGVEIFEPAAKEAIKFYKTVHIGDIEELNMDYNNYFDLVICGDVLEHLKEPFEVIKKIHSWLKTGGRIICSVPNVRYWRIWKDLIFQGNWEYTKEGILDQTHLRFFTSRSFKKMLSDASFVIEYEDMRIAIGPKQQAFNRLTFGVFKEFLGIQMLISARKN